jgi:ParB family chromosome partitioning protein
MASAKKQTSTDGSAVPKRAPRRKQAAPASRGLDAAELLIGERPAPVAALGEAIAGDGGSVLAVYRDPVGGHWQVLAGLPIERVLPTPFQRDLSETHVKRLAAVVDKLGRFLDPVIAVRQDDGTYWTPNGHHRTAAVRAIGGRSIVALVLPDREVAYQILALNTEKAHNLKDRSLEVIRMARELARRKPREPESSFSAEFEAPEFLTLGILYEKEKKFAGAAYRPFLRKVDRFADAGLATSLDKRQDYAARVSEIDTEVKRIVAELQKKGFKSPYLRTYVVARINPVRFHKAEKGDTKPPMPIAAALTKMAASARRFDVNSVNPGDLALVAAVSTSDE